MTKHFISAPPCEWTNEQSTPSLLVAFEVVVGTCQVVADFMQVWHSGQVAGNCR